MTSVGRRPSLVLTFTRDVTFVQPGYPISSTPKTLSRQNGVSGRATNLGSTLFWDVSGVGL
jgi:hypothetical protein